MPRYDPVRLVDQNGGIKAERFNAVGDRADLLRGMLSRIGWIRNNAPDGQIGDDSVRGESRFFVGIAAAFGVWPRRRNDWRMTLTHIGRPLVAGPK